MSYQKWKPNFGTALSCTAASRRRWPRLNLFLVFLFSLASERRRASRGKGIQDGLSGRLSWSGVQHHEAVLEPGSCGAAKLSHAEGVAAAHQQRHGEKTVMGGAGLGQRLTSCPHCDPLGRRWRDVMRHETTKWKEECHPGQTAVPWLASCAAVGLWNCFALSCRAWMINCHIRISHSALTCFSPEYLQRIYVFLTLLYYIGHHGDIVYFSKAFNGETIWLNRLNPVRLREKI